MKGTQLSNIITVDNQQSQPHYFKSIDKGINGNTFQKRNTSFQMPQIGEFRSFS